MKGVSLIKQKRGGALNIVLDKKKASKINNTKSFSARLKLE